MVKWNTLRLKHFVRSSNVDKFIFLYCLISNLYSPKQHIAKNRLIRYLFVVFFLAHWNISLFSFNLLSISKTWSSLHFGEIICNSRLVALGVNQNDLQMLTIKLIAETCQSYLSFRTTDRSRAWTPESGPLPNKSIVALPVKISDRFFSHLKFHFRFQLIKSVWRSVDGQHSKCLRSSGLISKRNKQNIKKWNAILIRFILLQSHK